MTFLTTGNALEAVIDAVVTALKADTTLMALVTGVYGHVPRAARTAYPYLVIGTPAIDPDEFGGMGIGGGQVTFVVDGWSNAKGPHAMREILARVCVVLDREDLTIVGHTMAGGSLHYRVSTVWDESDPDMPEELLYHGHQEWEADVEEA